MMVVTILKVSPLNCLSCDRCLGENRKPKIVSSANDNIGQRDEFDGVIMWWVFWRRGKNGFAIWLFIGDQ